MPIQGIHYILILLALVKIISCFLLSSYQQKSIFKPHRVWIVETRNIKQAMPLILRE